MIEYYETILITEFAIIWECRNTLGVTSDKDVFLQDYAPVEILLEVTAVEISARLWGHPVIESHDLLYLLLVKLSFLLTYGGMKGSHSYVHSKEH